MDWLRGTNQIKSMKVYIPNYEKYTRHIQYNKVKCKFKMKNNELYLNIYFEEKLKIKVTEGKLTGKIHDDLKVFCENIDEIKKSYLCKEMHIEFIKKHIIYDDELIYEGNIVL